MPEISRWSSMHTVKRTFYLKDYKLLVEFEDKKLKVIDLKEDLWGVNPSSEIAWLTY